MLEAVLLKGQCCRAAGTFCTLQLKESGGSDRTRTRDPLSDWQAFTFPCLWLQ